MGLYFNYDEPFTSGLKCTHLFDITAINDYDANNIDDSLLMMIGTTQSAVRDCRPMYLAGAVLGTGTHILINMAAMHNDIDIVLGPPWLVNLGRLT